jgi:hypothetical protein
VIIRVQREHPLDLKARFTAIKRQTFPWVYQVTKCAVEGAFRNLAAVLSNFFASRRGQRKSKPIGFPKFKRKKRGRGSFYLANDKFSVDGQWLLVPKLGRVNMTEPLRFAGKILGATISERAAGGGSASRSTCHVSRHVIMAMRSEWMWASRNWRLIAMESGLRTKSRCARLSPKFVGSSAG